MAGKTIAVLGGGVGGLITARELRKRLGKEHRVIVVDKTGKHTFWPSLLWLQVGTRKPDGITRDLDGLKKKGIEVIKDEVTHIDPERKTIQFDGNEIEADYIVVSLGAQLAPELVPGLSESGHNIYSLDGATAIRDSRSQITEGNITVLISKMPFKCPAAPYEAAMLLDADLRKRKVRGNVTISLYSPEPRPMGVAGAEMSNAVVQLLRERDIAYHPLHEISEVDSSTKTLKFSNETEANFDFLVYIPPHVAPTVVKDAGLTGESGWVSVDRHTLETQFPGVYAIGDVTAIPLAMGLPLPKAGVFAHGEAQVVAKTISAQIKGSGETATFNGHGECFIEVGGGKAGFGSGNFYGDPTPTIKLYHPSRVRHIGKVLFEKDWMIRRWL